MSFQDAATPVMECIINLHHDLMFFITLRKFYVTLVNNFNSIMSKNKSVKKEKIVAEQLNGRFAMIGFIAAVGAYLTTGQIIPGFV